MSETQSMTDVKTRWMIRKDMPTVVRIEQESFDQHWSEDDFSECLTRRNCIGFVAETGGEVVGYIIYELFKSRLYIVKLAVAPERRREGVGSTLLKKLKIKLNGQRRKYITLEVRETNLDAQRFYHKNGFRAIRVIRDFYEDTGEDAYRMEYFVHDAEGDQCQKS